VFYAFLPTKAVTEGKMNVGYVQVIMSQLEERSTAGQLVAKLTELTPDKNHKTLKSLDADVWRHMVSIKRIFDIRNSADPV